MTARSAGDPGAAGGLFDGATAGVDHRGEDNPRDVASMKAEISDLQSKTTASLDRSIAAAQASLAVGNRVADDLQTQREQMGQIEREARNIDADLKRTGYNLKHGFTWRGALTAPFRRASKKPGGAPAGGGDKRDIAPVYRDDYNSGDRNTQSKGGLFGRKGAAATQAGAQAISDREGPRCPEHVPEGFEKQLDDLDGLLDGLNTQAKAIGAELRQQNEGIEVLGDKVEPLRAETASQAQQIKRRFRVRG